MPAPIRSQAQTDPAEPAGAGVRSRSVTLKDVARLAGMSPITVSRALHNPRLVRPETAERAKQAAAAIGYIPNMLANSLARKRSRMIAAIVPQLSNSMFADAVQGLGRELAAHGYQLLLSVSDYSRDQEEDLLAGILSRQPDGIVLIGINHQSGVRKMLLAANVPVVEAWDLTPTPIDMVVGFSHEAVGEKVAHYLMGKGFRRFAVLSGDDERATKRRMGLESALKENGIDTVATHLAPLPTTLDLGRRGLSALLDAGSNPDVIVCSSDVLAHGVLIEAGERGIRVPGQLAVMGFGDFDFAAHTAPAISSVHVEKRAIGTIAARSLIARIEGRPLDASVIDVGFRLVERATTRVNS
jgi:LacI family gluconate utilization system Gnt-I transcriptional repressor